jgi:hypothetical protein
MDTTPDTTGTTGTTGTDSPVQLTLLPRPSTPVQFRLDEATRERGRRHVAEIRQLLAARKAAATRPSGRGPARPPSAAAPGRAA